MQKGGPQGPPFLFMQPCCLDQNGFTVPRKQMPEIVIQ